MIQAASPAPFPALALMGDMPVMPAAEGADGADFGALLALQGAVTTSDTAASAPQPATAAIVIEATIPATLPGKTLPLDLPDAPAAAPPAELPSAIPLPAAATLVVRSAKGAAKPETSPKPQAQEEAEVALDQLELVNDAPPTAELPLLAALPASETKPATPMAEAAPTPVSPLVGPERDGKPKPEHERASQDPAHRTIPILPAGASAQAQAQIQRHAAQALVMAPRAVSEPVIEPVQPAHPASPPSAAPAEQVRAQLALPRLAGAGALNRDEARPLAKLPELMLPDAVSPLSASPSPPQTTATPQSAPIAQVRPQDFAKLIDRITVAREAASPQTVSITVPHQDFGSVRLSFRPEDTGLSIAMSSPDPGFARAAAAMPAPVLPVAASDQAGLSQNQRGDSSSAQTGDQPQSRGGSSDPRRDGQPQPHANPAPRGHRDRPAARSGIFA